MKACSCTPSTTYATSAVRRPRRESSMTELTTRLPCPVCLGVKMDKVTVGSGNRLELDHCRRCGGVWFEPGEVQHLRAIPQKELWRQLSASSELSPALCQTCHAPLERRHERCPACGAPNVLDCPDCDRPMHVETFGGMRLDVCRRCKGVWFDHHEIEAIWGAALDQSLQKRKLSRGRAVGDAAEDAGDVLLTSLFFAPDLMFYGAYAAGHAVSAVAEGISRMPEAI